MSFTITNEFNQISVLSPVPLKPIQINGVTIQSLLSDGVAAHLQLA